MEETGWEVYGNSLLSLQLVCKSKAVLKLQVYLKVLKIPRGKQTVAAGSGSEVFFGGDVCYKNRKVAQEKMCAVFEFWDSYYYERIYSS